MCGILVHDGSGNNKFIQKRGQDITTIYEANGITFTHNLLHITGEITPQPFVSPEGDIVAVYNGEIYNQPFNKSDGECIIPLYKKYGIDFPKYLDGEYAIVLFDFNMGQALYVTDIFATKPLWRNGIWAASYQSGVGGKKIPASTIEVFNLYTHKLLCSLKYFNFDFNSQNVSNYELCIDAFEKAVKKRAKKGCFIGLSSGYDSGAISCALNNLGEAYKAFTVMASEDEGIVAKRAKLIKDLDVIYDFFVPDMEKHLAENAEEFFYNIKYDWGVYDKSYKLDYAAKALSYICKLASREGRKVYLSGQGADEILSDYSLIPMQSTLFGKFEDKMDLWPNFYGNCQSSYLGKEECVAGSWNIETRYPFLDKEFVQQFLYLKPSLKNRNYKSVIHEYLTRNNYPFQPNRKIGFSI